MKSTGCLLSTALIMMFVFLPIMYSDVFVNYISYMQMTLLLFGVTIVFFGLWWWYAHKLKNPGLEERDKMYEIQLQAAEIATPNKKSNKKKKKKNTDEDKPSFKFKKLFYGALFWAGLCCSIVSCEYKFMTTEDFSDIEQTTVWNAENIPLPHLTDGRLYVSNPDSILREETVDSMNVILKQLEDEIGVESAVIIVKKIENADAYRMAIDVGNKHGVGKKETNRGLVIVVAYEDHRYFIAPGEGLEAELTDAECNRLATGYLTPFLREYNPDGGMKMLVEATYNLLKNKQYLEEPDSNQLAGKETSDEENATFETIMMGFLIFWFILYSMLNETYNWVNLSSSGTGFTGFGRSRIGGGSSTWGSIGGGGFGGGFGGGYGGGSFGGGGAGGSW